MSNQNKKRKFTKLLTFKVLFGLVVLVFLGLIYNLIVASDEVPMTEQEEEEVQQRNAEVDTIDVVGNYLWPKMKSSREDKMIDEEKAAEAEKAKAGKDDKGKEASDKVLSNQYDAPIAAPAPDVTPSSELPAKQAAPSIEKMEAPKIEKIE